MIEYITELRVTLKDHPGIGSTIVLSDVDYKNSKETLDRAWQGMAYDALAHLGASLA